MAKMIGRREQDMHKEVSGFLPDISPEDLTMLQAVFDSFCRKSGWQSDSPQGNESAARLIHLFQHGVRSEDKLERMLAACVAEHVS